MKEEDEHPVLEAATRLSLLNLRENTEDEQEPSNFYPLDDCRESNISIDVENEIECPSEKSKLILEFNEFFARFTQRITKLNVNDQTKNEIYVLCADLIKQTQTVNCAIFVEEPESDVKQVLDATTEFVCGKLVERSTAYRRQNILKKNELFVPCQEYSLGVKWEMLRDKTSQISVPRLTQCKFQYISIIDTIKALFKRDDFRDAYFEYNLNRKDCKKGVYNDIRCGSMFSKNELFQENPYAIQVHIANDDFEVCNPLGSKATLHKLSGFYFTVQNMPPQFISKLENIFLFCLCYADDLKTKHTDINDIWRLVKKDIDCLETEGIFVNDFNLKGTIASSSLDNLGFNQAYGFVSCFVATFYCRFCEMPITECRNKCQEDTTKLRTIDSYNKTLKHIENSTKVDVKETRGIKMKCVLNELKYFHMLNNRTVDIMHDLNEGVVPFAVKYLVSKFIDLKILSEDKIIKKIQFFDYGFTNQRNIPSQLSLDKSNLGQNATQNRCLLQHIPFIFWDYRNNSELKDIWDLIESLMNIFTICYSSEIHQSDVDRLRKEIERHLTILKKLKLQLTAKHHLLLHYGGIIEEMGPLLFMSMFRFESKHKSLKSYMKNNSNFKNVTYTIARKHQEYLAGVKNSYKDEFITGSAKNISQNLIDSHSNSFSESMLSDTSVKMEVKFLKYCNNYYKEGLFIFEHGKFQEIRHILQINRNYYFICASFDILNFNKILNSFEIKKEHGPIHTLIEFSSLPHKNVYEKKHLNNSFYIICDTLYLKKVVEKN